MSSRHHKLHYKTRLSIALCGIVLIPVVVSVILYNIFFAGYNRRTQLENCDSRLAETVANIRANIEKVLEEMNQFETEEGLLDFLCNPARYSLADKIDIFRTNKNILLEITQQSPKVVETLKVYGQYILPEMITPGPMYPMNMLRAEKPELVKKMESTGKLYFYCVDQCLAEGELEPLGRQMLNVYRTVRDVRGNLIAVNEAGFSFAEIADLAAEFPFEQYFLIYEGTGGKKILLHGEDEELAARIFREYEEGDREDQTRKYIVRQLNLLYFAEADENGRRDCISLFIPKSAIKEQEIVFWRNIFLITLVMMLVIAGVIQIVSHALTKELYQLLDDIRLDYPKLIAEKETSEVVKMDEFGWIRKKFNDIITEVSDYSDQVMRAEYEQRILKAELMQDLISPHFLYNTLDGLRWSTDDPNLIRVIETMVNFYRLALNKGEMFTTMDRELEMARSYLEVQAFAYESQFRYEIEVPDSLRNVKLMKYLLQPILENALVHGIDKRGDHGYIRIRVWEQAGRLLIEILDNGAGMSEEKIAQLMDVSSNVGYGIHNVMQRIRLFYGEEYGIHIVSEMEKGTTVLVTLPIQSP